MQSLARNCKSAAILIMPLVNTASFIPVQPGTIIRESDKISNRIFDSVIYDSNFPFSVAKICFSILGEHGFGYFPGFFLVEEQLG